MPRAAALPALVLLCAAACPMAVFAGDGGLSRAIRIIEEAPKLPDAPPAEATPAPAPAQPSVPAQALPIAKGANAAGLTVEILPGRDLAPGTQISFRVTTQKPGWLILVDVDAAGKLSQIFPNGLASIYQKAAEPGSNKIGPGRAVLVPDAADAKAYEFVASPPSGAGMIVAMLSDKPVDVVDLPDVPAALAGQAGALDFVKENARSLRIVQEDETADPVEPQWSFDTKAYAIK